MSRRGQVFDNPVTGERAEVLPGTEHDWWQVGGGDG